MYKSEKKHNKHYFLLHNEKQKHYNCITDIKKFMGVREFCYKCLNGFTHKDAHEKHVCDDNYQKREIRQKD